MDKKLGEVQQEGGVDGGGGGGGEGYGEEGAVGGMWGGGGAGVGGLNWWRRGVEVGLEGGFDVERYRHLVPTSLAQDKVIR